MMSQAVLDTDTLSAILRQNPIVLPKARAYLAQNAQFTFSIITRYEILRGLKSKRATAQLAAFEQFCSSNVILPLTNEIVIRASDIYADLKQKGLLVGDADILIAASALVQGCAVITNNEKHFCRIPNLQILNWLRI
jgi:tRNA(fMet)-specific endonuclease VapC